jgi:membrane protein YdbS with pleckstrin-like domain
MELRQMESLFLGGLPMRCPECGVEVVEGAVFCHKCGRRLDQPESRQDVPPDPPAETPPETAASPVAPAEKFKEAAASRLDAEETPEHELWRGGYSPKAMFGAWACCTLITLALLVGGLFWAHSGSWWLVLFALIILTWGYNLICLFHRRMSVSYILTNQRFIHESGIVRRVTDRIEVIEIDDITFEQGIIERLTGVGTIRITSSDRSHPEILLPGIEKVREVSGLFDDTRRAERRRRGLHIENI